MLRFFYQTFLPLTVAGTVAMLLLFVIAPLEKRMSSRWRYYIRLVPLVLFTVPFAVALPFLQRPATQLVAAPAHTLVAVGEFLGEVAVPATVAPLASPAQVLMLLWAVGASALACYYLLVWVQFNITLAKHSTAVTDTALLRQFDACKKQVRASRRVRLRLCPQIGSPMLVGILRPMVLLPCVETEEQELWLILRHELTHCKRADLAYKLAALAVKTMHWFNPLAYLLARQITELCELSCDEALVRAMDNKERRRYAFTILNQMDSSLCKIPEVTSSFSRGKNRVKRRMNLIMTFKKPRRLIFVAGVCSAIFLCTVGVFASSALNADNTLQASDAQIDESKIISAQGTITLDVPEQGGQTLSPKATEAKEQQGVLIAEDSVLQEATAEEEIAASKKESDIAAEKYGTELRELKLVWPIGKLEKAALDAVTGEEKAKNFISTPIWGYRGHTGIDIVAPKGSEIIAASSGKVIKAEKTAGGYGGHIIISHEGGITTLYGHCDELLAAVGDEVEQGDVIAKVGRTGNSTGYQCHFEVRSGGSYLDPSKFIGYKAP